MSVKLLRQLPGVNDLLSDLSDMERLVGHRRVTEAIRGSLQAARLAIRANGQVRARDSLIAEIRHGLEMSTSNFNSHVINATGVIIHTNLGRVVLSQAAQTAMLAAANAYQALEFDLKTGQRGRRGVTTEQILTDLTHAEDALVVNNCAAATVLMLSALAAGRGVVISRGELVEIGGGFRVPEIMEQSGARLIEVGTTNKTRRVDYEHAIESNPDAIAILRAHPSNFRSLGFTENVPLIELTHINATHRGVNESDFVPVIHDLGSGAVLDTTRFGLLHEPMVQESVSAGAILTAFSGDKLLGGPQAGIIVGAKRYVDMCRNHPLARAFRADKFTLAALGATALHYLLNEAEHEIPVWRMISLSQNEIRCRAELVMGQLKPWLGGRAIEAQIVDGESTVGGGSLPGEALPTALISLSAERSTQLLGDLRKSLVPIVARIQNAHVLIDLRTVLDDTELVQMIASL